MNQQLPAASYCSQDMQCRSQTDQQMQSYFCPVSFADTGAPIASPCLKKGSYFQLQSAYNYLLGPMKYNI